MRELSRKSGDAGSRIAITVNDFSKTVEDTLTEAMNSMKGDLESEENGKEVIKEVMESLQFITDGLTQSTNILSDESEGIILEINDILVSLQFQDRVNQILNHVCESLHAFTQFMEQEQQQQLVNAGHVTNAAKFLATLETSYTTDEERNIHQGKGNNDTNNGDLEFF